MKIYDNPVGVLTNNPPFNYQMFNLNNYMQLAVENRSNTFSENLGTESVQAGEWDGMGLPGDLSSLVKICAGGLCKNELSVRGFRRRKCKPVFPHSWQRRPAERLLQAGRRQV